MCSCKLILSNLGSINQYHTFQPTSQKISLLLAPCVTLLAHKNDSSISRLYYRNISLFISRFKLYSDYIVICGQN